MSNWIKWNGGECPVQQNTPVDVRYRDGQEKFNVPALKNVPGREASSAYWKHSNYVNDIVAYRLSEVDNLQSRVNDTSLQQIVKVETRVPSKEESDAYNKRFDSVQRPAHYNQSGIECIDAIAAAVKGKSGTEAVYVANVIKYLWRYELKNGVEDCRKAQWYLDRLVKELDK